MKKFFSSLFVLFSIMFTCCAGGKKVSDVLNGKEGVFAIMDVTQGTIVLELYYDKTPLTVTNFVGLAEGTLDAAKGKPFYDGLTFHRVIDNFMIQGGDPKGTGAGGPGYKFADEIVDDLKFTGEGILAMANAGAGTNGSQFFITHVKTDWLDGKHTIFGKVLEGQDVVNKTKQGDKIKKLTIVRQGDGAKNFTAMQADFDLLAQKVIADNAAKKERELADFIAGCTKSPEGIYYNILSEGNGSKIGKGKAVRVEYKGYFADGSVFDGSAKMVQGGHEPLDFTTGAGQMIQGFDIMVQDMKVGETRKMVLPPEYGYGARGIPGVIPGGAYLAFDVMVVSAR